MSRGIKIGIAVIGMVIVLTIAAVVAIVALFIASRPSEPQASNREIRLANQGSLVIGADVRGRSEDGTSQSAGYRPPESTEIEWFGDVSDGVEPQVYFAGPLVVVIDLPSACLFVRNPKSEEKWKSLALIFPDDIGPFPIPYYAERNGLTQEEVSRISELGGKRERKYPTTYIQSFDPETRHLNCTYHVDNKSAWPLDLRLFEDGTHFALVAIGESNP